VENWESDQHTMNSIARGRDAALADEELAELAASELSAFTFIYERFRKPIYRYVRSQVRDEATAEDLTAQVFFKAIASASSYRGEGTYRAWLFQIARNVVSTWHAQRRKTEIPMESFPDELQVEDGTVSQLLAEEERDIVLETIADLPEPQREVIALRYFRDLPIEEIARLTRRSTGAVRQLLHRARARIRRRLSRRDLTVLISATGASALAAYSLRRHHRRTK
jgi:RNA polymerase sigma-70 factor (ECF subfamily)